MKCGAGVNVKDWYLTRLSVRGIIVLASVGNSEIGAHVNGAISLLFDLFKAFDEIGSAVTHRIFLRKDLFFFMRAHHVLSYHLN